ncbi:MAG: DUF4097 domain-containing protein [Sporichthyaceae bacterium]|nr:DUF4097 domain-containing protein [Sporichthyaceae bacterium]
MRPGQRLAVAVLGTAGAVVALGACDLGERQRFEADAVVSEKIDLVRIEGGSGQVSITTGSGSSTAIHTLVEYRGERPTTPAHRVDNGDLVLSTDCGRNCSVNYRVTVPAGVSVTGRIGSGDIDLAGVAGVEVESGSGTISVEGVRGSVRAEAGSGDVTARGITGNVELSTGSGTITVTEVSGTVTVDADSGDINARELTGNIEAHTGSGTIDVRLASPASVTADAGSEDISVTVPEGSYRVLASADSGDRTVSVPDQPGAPNSLDVHTGSGTVTVRSAGG